MRFLVLLFSIFFILPLHAQIIDTIFNGDNFVIRDRMLITIDNATWKHQRVISDLPVQQEYQATTEATRTQNDCGVTASFTPAGDSAFSGNIQQTFTNTSTNASTFQWIVDGISIYNSQPTLTNWFTTVGLHEIKLVVKNGNCTDTATTYYLQTGDKPPSSRRTLLAHYGLPNAQETATTFDALKDGSFLLGGYNFVYNSQEGNRGFLMKVKETGCVEWTKLFQKELGGRISLVKALGDSGFLVSVATSLKSVLMRFDKAGTVVWKYSYLAGTSSLSFCSLFETTDGSIIAGAGNGSWNGLYVLKLTRAGNVVWSKYYQKASLDMGTPLGITELGSNLYVSGYINNPNQEVPYNSEYNKDGFILSLTNADGITNWSKLYGAVGFTDFFQDIHSYGNNLLVNSIRGKLLGGSLALQTFHFINQQGNVIKSNKVINSPVLEFPFNTQVLPLADDKLYLVQCGYQSLSLQPGYIYHSNWQKIDTSNRIYWQNIFSNSPRGRFTYSAVGRKESLASLGTEPNLLLRPVIGSDNFLFVKIDSSGVDFNDGCTFYKSTTSIVPDTLVVTNLSWIKDSAINVSRLDIVTDPNISYGQVRYACPDFVDSCSYVKVNGTLRLCNLKNVYSYRVSKNRACLQPVQWDLSEGIQVVTMNDTLLQVRFPAFGSYKIGVLLANTCTPVKDSVIVVVQSNSAVLNLGADTSICPNTTIQLHAGKTFLQYKWQDNSTDSVFTVTQAGRYWVEVIDSCGNTLHDSIFISEATNLTIDLGPDRKKCNSDTIHLEAPPGFVNYNWSNNYNLSSTTTRMVVANPLVDTAYYIRAEKMLGCFAFDTIRVHVNTSPPIELGPDVSFCMGDSAVFRAGSGFSQYQWNNGKSTPQITVSAAGTYFVTALTQDGCKSYDTVRVTNIFTNPVVQLDHTTTLCNGTSRLLDAGNFTVYKWSDGSTKKTFLVSAPGSYAVEVTDNNGCRGRDTTIITTLLPLPSQFLSADTAICSYGSVTLTTNNTYKNYLWNTGATTPSFLISKAGLYWLQVQDTNNCIGRDTVVVNPKDCMKGLYVPTAFTPNGDGRNDKFRPLLFGNIKKYQFVVYNRWGQIIYFSTEINKGWDGTTHGLKQDNNVYIWTCTYQLEGEALKVERGTVMLIR